MDKIAAGSSSDRRDLFRESISRLGMNLEIVEKDFWVCFVLTCVIYAAVLGMVARCLGWTTSEPTPSTCCSS
jgi:hypothetical protein